VAKYSIPIIFYLSSLLLTFSNGFASEQIAYAPNKHALYIPHAKTIIQRAQNNLPHYGVLTEGNDGYIYLKVDDDYINHLFPILSNREYTKPPYFRRPNSPGAHISVIYVDERQQTGEITEVGQTYSFKIVGLNAVPSKTLKYIVLEVNSPELENLRKKYGLSPLLKNHEFHITIAKKKE
jgi:hypothetical protein